MDYTNIGFYFYEGFVTGVISFSSFFIKPRRVELCVVRPFIKVGKYS